MENVKQKYWSNNHGVNSDPDGFTIVYNENNIHIYPEYCEFSVINDCGDSHSECY